MDLRTGHEQKEWGGKRERGASGQERGKGVGAASLFSCLAGFGGALAGVGISISAAQKADDAGLLAKTTLR